MPDAEPSTVFTGPVRTGVPVDSVFCIAPTTGGGIGPHRDTVWLAPVPVNFSCSTKSSIASPVLSTLIWYSWFGSNDAPGVEAGVRNAQLLRTSAMRPGAEPGNA